MDIEKDEGMLELQKKLFKLIGKLQAYKHNNTKDVNIPDEFKSRCKATDSSLGFGIPCQMTSLMRIRYFY